MGYNPNFIQKGNKIVLKLKGDNGEKSPLMDLINNKIQSRLKENIGASYNDYFKNMMKEKAQRER